MPGISNANSDCSIGKSFPGKVLVIEYESNIFTSKTSIEITLKEIEANKQKIVIYLIILKFDIVI